MSITATTKRYEMIPDEEGKQELIIPAPVNGAEDSEPLANPLIHMHDPQTKSTGILFGINIEFPQGGLPIMIDHLFTYDEIFAIIGIDLTPFYNPTGLDNYVSIMQYVMSVLAGIPSQSISGFYDQLILEVSWLKGLIQEKTV